MNYLLNKKYIAVFALLGFLMLALFGLSFATTMENDMGHIGATLCPYEAGQLALCPMNVFDHISEWQAAIQTTLTNSFLLLLLSAFVFLGVLLYIKNFDQLREFFVRFRIRNYERKRFSFYNPILYQHLFSQGILNTKEY